MGYNVHLQRRGQELYRQKEYKAALEYFTQAVKGCIKIPFTALDNRAATYSKLGNFQAALSDGQRMIRSDKTNGIGYLRTGQVLQLMGKCDVARDIYEMGIGKVTPTDDEYPLLQDLHQKLIMRIVKDKASDPFETLPLELAYLILGRLEFHDIGYCLRVSKSWSKLLESMPNLWMDLDFSKAKRPLTLNTIRKYIKRGQGLATRATLPSFGSSAEGMPSYITKRCKNLEELSILKGVAGETILFASSYATNLKSLIMGQQCEVTMDCVHQLLYNCENLERAEFHYIIRAHAESWSLDMPKLQSLILSTSEVMKTPSAIIDVGALAQRIPNIRSLVLRWWATRDLPPHAQTQPIPDFSTLEKLETLDITGLRTEQIIRFPSNLCKLDLSRVAGSHAVVEEGQFKRLTWLSVEDSFCMTNNNLKRMLHANKGNLEYFNARYALSDGNYIVDLITAPYFTNTVEINFDYCDVSDAHGVVLCRYATNLKRATFQATRISGAGIGAMLRGTYGPCKLEYLCLNCCSNCSGDVVERARKMGIKTDYKFPVEQLKGRKIRGA